MHAYPAKGIRLKDGYSPNDIRDQMDAWLPDDVLVMTKTQFVQREKNYWNSATPIGYVFAFGAIMGFVVGAIIVYQILFADVSEHLNEYATLRAIGYPNRFVSGIVLQEAVILAVLGFLPGLGTAWWLYGKAAAATNLPLNATFVDNGDGTGDFSFTPDFTQQGVYNVTFTATDDGLATDDEIVAITVNQVNLPPVLDPIGPQSIAEGHGVGVVFAEHTVAHVDHVRARAALLENRREGPVQIGPAVLSRASINDRAKGPSVAASESSP